MEIPLPVPVDSAGNSCIIKQTGAATQQSAGASPERGDDSATLEQNSGVQLGIAFQRPSAGHTAYLVRGRAAPLHKCGPAGEPVPAVVAQRHQDCE
eukprot:scaffold66490_cov16-Tisochrysis_lutea.AAC.1